MDWEQETAFGFSSGEKNKKERRLMSTKGREKGGLLATVRPSCLLLVQGQEPKLILALFIPDSHVFLPKALMGLLVLSQAGSRSHTCRSGTQTRVLAFPIHLQT